MPHTSAVRGCALTHRAAHRSLPHCTIYEFAVDTYEIRILRKGIKAPDIFSSSHVSDHAAVRRAQALADAGDAVEVWRGAACVYSGSPQDEVVH